MVHIVTDASVRFTQANFAREHNIVVAPLNVRCQNRQIPDGPETNLASARPMLEMCGPDTQIESPSVETFLKIYTQLQSQTHEIISIHNSAGLSKTFQNAYTASQQFRGRMDIQVIDSQTVSIGLGLIVQSVAQAAQRGESLDGLVQIIRSMIPRLYMVLFLDDLYFLERNNLVSRSQAILGNMLGILPFLTMEDGSLIPMEKVRIRTRAIEKLVEFVCEFSGVEHLGILQNRLDPDEESLAVYERLRAVYPAAPITSVCYGSMLSTYVGYNALGAIVLESQEEML
ncbi:MAG: DegV family protein [Anaerolineales bacterium]|nr:DegV family protein [Anaerolineales bacterium]